MSHSPHELLRHMLDEINYVLSASAQLTEEAFIVMRRSRERLFGASRYSERPQIKSLLSFKLTIQTFPGASCRA